MNKKTILSFGLILCLFLLSPPYVLADSQSEYHNLCLHAEQSGLSPDSLLTGKALSGLLSMPLSESNESLSLGDLCTYMRSYLRQKKLVLLQNPNDYPLPDGAKIEPDVLYCFQGGILGKTFSSEMPEEPIPLGYACLILSQLFCHAHSPDYEQPVSTMVQNEQSDSETLKESLIMGHSNVVGLYLSVDSPLSYAAKDGASSYDFLKTSDLILGWGRSGRALDALTEKQYRFVYIMLGTNDCSDTPDSISKYKCQMSEIIELTQYLQPNAEVCLIGISPIGFEESPPQRRFRQNIIQNYNQAQKSLCRDYQIHYLDIFSVLADETGFNSPELARKDGVHYNEKGYDLILKEIYTHPLS